MVEQRYRTFWRRVGAGFLDGLVLAPIGGLSFWVYRSVDAPIVVAVVFIVNAAAGLAYSVAMHAAFGQTLGKMATHVRVIDSGERASITGRQAILRDGVLIAFTVLAMMLQLPAILRGVSPLDLADEVFSSAVLGWGHAIWFFAEITSTLTNQRRRAVHDLIAGTVVVRVGDVPSPRPASAA